MVQATVTVITPTCDRPHGIKLAEGYMRRQTRQPDEWIVADGGHVAAPCTMGQCHIHKPCPAGPENFGRNLLNACMYAHGDVVVLWEDDDWYAPTYIERLLEQLAPKDALIAGDDDQRYYHVGLRRWKTWTNRGACLCQTGFKRPLLPYFKRTVQSRIKVRSYGVDGYFWRQVPRFNQSLVHTGTVVGIKGLPGRAGLGLGHRPKPDWTPDPDLRVLRQWIGEDAQLYAGLQHTIQQGVATC